jgi:hypothetical protein
MLAIETDTGNAQGGAGIQYKQKHADKTVMPPTKFAVAKASTAGEAPGARKPASKTKPHNPVIGPKLTFIFAAELLSTSFVAFVCHVSRLVAARLGSGICPAAEEVLDPLCPFLP